MLVFVQTSEFACALIVLPAGMLPTRLDAPVPFVTVLPLAVFVVFVWDVQWNGDVHPSAERFMDYAIIERIGLTKVFPPLDAWMAGKTLQYYYYGYVLMDVLRRLAGMDLRWFFDLAIPANYTQDPFARGAIEQLAEEFKREWPSEAWPVEKHAGETACAF